MSRILSLAVIFTTGILSFATLSGCANFLDGRSVNRYHSAWNAQDIKLLRGQSSERFQKTALYRRDEDVQADLKQLSLPEGKLTVTNVELMPDDRKKIRVSSEGSKREMQYIFVKNKATGKWVVDDILMQQRRSKGLRVVRSVSEQMNLLQSVRDFRDAWSKGQRQPMLAMLAPELRKNISSLPPGYFQKLSNDISAKIKTKADRKPNAELNGKNAIVSIRGAKGKVRLVMKKELDQWKIQDFAIEGTDREDHIPSVKKLAQVLNTSASFLNAYVRSDLKTLERISHRELFKGGLSSADLRSIKLPTSAVAQKNYNVILKKHRAEFVINTEDRVVKLSLLKDIVPTETESNQDFVISEVTIYDRLSAQKTELTSAFMGQAIVEIFHDSLVKKDIGSLRQISTKDLNNRVWNELDQSLIDQLPLATAVSSIPKIVRTEYRGVISRVHVLQGSRPIVYVLRKEAGRILVDDIESSKPGFEKSLKSVMQTMIPVRKFAVGVIARDTDILKRVSSKDFNRLIWNHVHDIPPTGLFIPKHIQAPLYSIRKIDEKIVVNLGDAQWGARIKMVEEYGKFLIDDIQLISGENPHERLLVKSALRTEVSNGIRSMAESFQRSSGNRRDSRELPAYLNGSSLNPKSGSIVDFPTEKFRKVPTESRLQNDRVQQTGFDQRPRSADREFPSNYRPENNAPTMPTYRDGYPKQETNSISPNRNAFGMNRKSLELPDLRKQDQPQLYPQQPSRMNQPTQSGQIPMSQSNPFDTSSQPNKLPPTSFNRLNSNMKLVPSVNSSNRSQTNPKIPLWDSHPDDSSSGTSNGQKLNSNQEANWESQNTPPSHLNRNSRFTSPSRTSFENRQMQSGLRTIPFNEALDASRKSSMLKSSTGSGLSLAPGIPAGKPARSEAKNPFAADRSTGVRR